MTDGTGPDKQGVGTVLPDRSTDRPSEPRARAANEHLAAELLRDLRGALAVVLARQPVERFVIAYSGGLDSSVLLQALVRLRPEFGCRLAALHVNHGLSPYAGWWQQYGERVAADSGVEWHAERVEVSSGTGLEARAREARYAVFTGYLRAGDVLLQAHHRDDQAETILFRLLRGHGVEGLCGIPAWRELGAGHVLRPLLGTPRDSLRRIAAHWHLSWVEDASNQCLDHDRNFLRQVILPQLATRFPAVGERIAQSGRWMTQAQSVLSAWAAAHLGGHEGGDGKTLDLAALADLPREGQSYVLREWLKRCGIRPRESALRELERRFFRGSVRTGARVRFAGMVLHHYRGRLHLLADETSGSPGKTPAFPVTKGSSTRMTAAAQDPEAGVGACAIEWEGLSPLTLVDGRVIQLPPEVTPSQGPFRVAFRRGGERWLDPRSGRHRDLKKVFQERGVPPWERDRIPLLFSGEELVAVLFEDS